MINRREGGVVETDPDRPRLMLVQHVTATTLHDPYLTLTALAAYAGVSVRQLREYLVNPPLPRDAGAPLPPPLPHYRLGGRIVVRRSEFDYWMAAYRARPSEARTLAHALRGLGRRETP